MHVSEDLQWYIGLFYTHPLPNENNFYIQHYVELYFGVILYCIHYCYF